MSNYSSSDIKIIEPDFGSKLTDLIIDLDYLRKKQLFGSTPPKIFFQIKKLFHLLESIGSARIEGNHTTIAEYIETKITGGKHKNEEITEIQNIETCMEFIDESINHAPINRIFISELHKHLVKNLKKEGGGNPGEYRKKNIRITQSKHTPPDFTQVKDYMLALFTFINDKTSPKYDLLKTALTHHRFVWIHPFDNGNGRAVRLLTYAMLIKQGFNINIGRIINPTAIFCSDRNKYYSALAQADSLKKQDLLAWCEYMLKGLKHEIEKIDRLLDYDYLKKNILIPTINFTLEHKTITPEEAKILFILIDKKIIQASDLKDIMPNKLPSAVSRTLRQLKDKKMIAPEKENSRKYILRFDNNYLLRGIIQKLADNNFLPLSEQ